MSFIFASINCCHLFLSIWNYCSYLCKHQRRQYWISPVTAENKAIWAGYTNLDGKAPDPIRQPKTLKGYPFDSLSPIYEYMFDSQYWSCSLVTTLHSLRWTDRPVDDDEHVVLPPSWTVGGPGHLPTSPTLCFSALSFVIDFISLCYTASCSSPQSAALLIVSLILSEHHARLQWTNFFLGVF